MSSKIQNIDRTPFWGPKITNELKYLQSILNNKNQSVRITKDCFREHLKGSFSFEFFFSF